nr:MAG TPA: hypothetical protein [Bacteriophage sp.]
MEYYRLQELQYVCHRETMFTALSLFLQKTLHILNIGCLFFIF